MTPGLRREFVPLVGRLLLFFVVDVVSSVVVPSVVVPSVVVPSLVVESSLVFVVGDGGGLVVVGVV